MKIKTENNEMIGKDIQINKIVPPNFNLRSIMRYNLCYKCNYNLVLCYTVFV